MIAAILQRPVLAKEDIAKTTGAVSDSPVAALCRESGWSNKDYITDHELERVTGNMFFSTTASQKTRYAVKDLTNFKYFVNVNIDASSYSFSMFPYLTKLEFPETMGKLFSETLFASSVSDGISELTLPDGCSLKNNIYTKGLKKITFAGNVGFDGGRIFSRINTITELHFTKPVDAFDYTNFYKIGTLTYPLYESEDFNQYIKSAKHIGGGSFAGAYTPQKGHPLISPDDQYVVISTVDEDFSKYKGIASYWSENHSRQTVQLNNITSTFVLQSDSLLNISKLAIDTKSSLDNIDFQNGSLSGYSITVGGIEITELIQKKDLYMYFAQSENWIHNDHTKGNVLIWENAQDVMDLSGKDFITVRKGALLPIKDQYSQITQSITSITLPNTVRYLADDCIDADTVSFTCGNKPDAVKYYGCTSIARKIPDDIYGYETSQWIFEDAYQICGTDKQEELKQNMQWGPLTLVMVNADAITDNKYRVADNVGLVLNAFQKCDDVYVIDLNMATGRNFNDPQRNKRVYYRGDTGIINFVTYALPAEIVLTRVQYKANTPEHDYKKTFLDGLCQGHYIKWKDCKNYYANRNYAKTHIYVPDKEYENISKYWLNDEIDWQECHPMSDLTSDDEFIANCKKK